MNKEKSHKINVYRLREETSFEAIDLVGGGYELEYSNSRIKLYVQKQKSSQPEWAQFLEKYLTSNIDDIQNKSSSFVFICRNNHNIYALTGGYGHNKLKALIDEEFGVQVAIRMIDENTLTALNQKSMKGHTRQIYRAVAGYNPLFDRENYTRILNAIEGKAEFFGKKFRIVGRSSLALRTTKDIEEIDDVFNEIEQILARSERIEFPKSYKVVKDNDLITLLNNEMLSLVINYWQGNEDRERLYLEFKDPFTQFRCDKYRIRCQRKKIEITEFDLDIVRDKLVEYGIERVETLEGLGSIKFSGENEAGIEEFKNETFLDLLICELQHGGRNYIKVRRKWYQILDEISRFIDEQIKLIPVDKDLLPDWIKDSYKKEKDYNEFVAREMGWACLDTQFIHVQGPWKWQPKNDPSWQPKFDPPLG